MTPRLLLNSTKPKDYARNAREEEVCGVCVCVCVCSILYPLLFIAGSHQLQHPKLTLSANREVPRALVEVVGPTGLAGRPGRSVGLPGPPTTPQLPRVGLSWSPLVLKLRHGLPQLGLLQFLGFTWSIWAESVLWYFLWFCVGPKCACNLHISLKTQLEYSKR